LCPDATSGVDGGNAGPLTMRSHLSPVAFLARGPGLLSGPGMPLDSNCSFAPFRFHPSM
jgi:hypothetical protein